MLGKSKPRHDPFQVELGKKLLYSMSEDKDNIVRSKHGNLPLRSQGQNSAIPNWMYQQLSNHWKANWVKLDLDAIFNQIDEELTPPISPTKPPFLKLSDDTKTKIKAFTLGEMTLKQKSKLSHLEK